VAALILASLCRTMRQPDKVLPITYAMLLVTELLLARENRTISKNKYAFLDRHTRR
jgi:hypothetical protein